MSDITAIDLFCGAGGLTRGLLDLGIDVICGIDMDEACKKTYEYNNINKNGEHVRYIKADIRQIDNKDINNILSACSSDYYMLAGCCPCQPFSNKNTKRDTDKRVDLLMEFARLIKDTKPDFVFMENVPGIEKVHNNVLNYFINTLSNAGYFYDYKVVNAKDYGVPQNRKRFILIASLLNCVSIPFVYSDKYTTVRDAIGNINKFPAINAGESHKTIFNHRCSNSSDLNLKRLRHTPKNGGSRKDIPDKLVLECHKRASGHGDSYGRMYWDKPAPTLTTKFYSITNGRYGHPEQDRAISIKEGAVIQGFPYEYEFYGNMQETARQIGNAVPPKMVKEILKEVKSGK